MVGSVLVLAAEADVSESKKTRTNISQPEELRQKTNKNVIVINCAGLKRPCVICDMRKNITMTLNESKAVTAHEISNMRQGVDVCVPAEKASD